MNLVGILAGVFARPDLWAGTLRFATPLTLAALGGVISERSGVVNIAMEGMMLVGAFFAVLAAAATGNVLVATLVSVACGGLIASVHGVASIQFKANQIVSGMAINLLALGLTSFLLFHFYSLSGTPPNVPALPDITLPVINTMPFVGKVIGTMNIATWLAILAVPITWWFLFRTTLGLRIRAVGEHPRAADTLGVNVYQTRYLCVILSGLLSGLGGAYLALGVAHSFSDNMTSGAGFIALAAMIFGKWHPVGAFLACLLFGFGASLGINLQGSGTGIPDQLISATPYILTVIALAGLVGRSTAPAADGTPYEVGE
jgi:simple sugar transport system permease protein